MGRSVPETVCIDGIKSTGPGGSPEERVYEYEIDLITPMYGGGVVAGVNEQERPIRVPSIRGQLRFWWRATRGTAFPSLEELKKREAVIWGSTEKASPTWVEVDCGPYNQVRERAANYGFNRGPETYALFPAVNNGQNLVKEGLKFKVTLRCLKEHEVDVQCAVWAWVNFGGLGARTRKGCGALFCRELAPKNAETFGTWLKENLQRYGVTSSVVSKLPYLSKKMLFGKAEGAALTAWSKGLAAIKEFRQGKGFARGKGSEGRPGRSYWPEPDTIRRALKSHAPAHTPDPNKPDGFPRALFGLPIVFHFRDERAGDPSTEAYPKGKKRMASPVLMRPLRTQDNQVVPAVVFLEGTRPDVIELKGCPRTFSTGEIVNPKFASYDKSPMGKPERDSSKDKRSSKGDALEAFRAYLKEKKYTEVSL